MVRSSPGRSVRAVIAHGDPLFLDAAGSRLDAAEGLAVVGTIRSGADAIHRVRELKPDVLVLDARVPEIDVTRVAVIARSLLPRLGILVLLHAEDEGYVRLLRDHGVRGFAPASVTADELVGAVRSVAAGKTTVLGGLASAAFARPEHRFTPRQREVLRLLALGRRNREIADALGVDVRAAEYHVRGLMDELGAHTRSEVVYKARLAGLRIDDIPSR